MTVTPAARQALRAQHLPPLLAAWNTADRSRQIRAVVNSGPTTLATIEAFIVTAETGRASTPAPEIVITDRADPRIPHWASDVVDRLAALAAEQVEKAFRWMSHQSMQHMTADLLHDGPVHRVTGRFDTPNDAEQWVAAAPDGYQVLFSHVLDLRAYPGERVTAQATVAPVAPFTVADAKALFAAHDLSVDPQRPETRQ